MSKKNLRKKRSAGEPPRYELHAGTGKACVRYTANGKRQTVYLGEFMSRCVSLQDCVRHGEEPAAPAHWTMIPDCSESEHGRASQREVCLATK